MFAEKTIDILNDNEMDLQRILNGLTIRRKKAEIYVRRDEFIKQQQERLVQG